MKASRAIRVRAANKKRRWNRGSSTSRWKGSAGKCSVFPPFGCARRALAYTAHTGPRRRAEWEAQYAARMAGLYADGGEEYSEEWEEWEEEGGYEYVSDPDGSKPESEEGHVEPAVLVQPLVGEQGNG